MFQNINTYLNLVGTTGGRKASGRFRRRWEAIIKVNLKEMA
jgi:hypothetical protein